MSEFSQKTLEKIRSKLLDLTRRNRLLNYKESIRSLRIVDQLPDEIFRLLVIEGKELELLPLDEQNEDQLLLNNSESNSNNKDRTYSKNEPTDKNNEIPISNGKTAIKHKGLSLQTTFPIKCLNVDVENLLVNQEQLLKKQDVIFALGHWFS